MHLAIVILLFVIIIIILIISGILNVAAAIRSIPADTNLDNEQRKAHSMLTTSSILTWITITIIVIIIGTTIYINGLMETINTKNLVVIVTGMLFITTIIVVVVSILSGLSASALHNSSNKDNQDVKTAYSYAITSAIIGIVSVFLLFIAIVIFNTLEYRYYKTIQNK